MDAADQAGLILAAWQRWEARTPEHLNGQFSFAVWHDGAVHLVRDHFGMTPLVWGRTPGGVVVGGDIRVALEADGISPTIDEDVFVTVVLQGHPHHWNMLGRTMFSELDAVRPAHSVVVTPAAASSTLYWDSRSVALVDERRPEALASMLRELLVDAVAECTPDDDPFVAHLSGGLDSSGIAALAARRRREIGSAPPLTISWSPGPQHGRTPEHDRADSVATAYGLDLVYAPGSVEDRIEMFYRDHTRDPAGMLGSELTPMRYAAQHGARVVLSGWGGDELASFSGRGMVVRELARTGRWMPLASMVLREKRGWRTLASGLIHKPGHNFSEWAKLSLAEKRDRALETDSSWLRREVLAAARLPSEPESTKSSREYICRLLDRGHLGIRGVDWGLESAKHGIRYRYPLLDRRIVEFSLGVPTEMWLNREGRRRWILAAALEGVVPDEVRFGVKQEQALNEWRQRIGKEANERASAQLVDLVAEGRQAHLFDIPRVQAQLRRGGGAAGAGWIGVPR